MERPRIFEEMQLRVSIPYVIARTPMASVVTAKNIEIKMHISTVLYCLRNTIPTTPAGQAMPWANPTRMELVSRIPTKDLRP